MSSLTTVETIVYEYIIPWVYAITSQLDLVDSARMPALVLQKLNKKLLSAASENKCARVDALIRVGADVDGPTGCAQAPLHHAAYNSRLKCTQLLLKHNADINRKELFGATAAYIAASNGDLAILKCLLDNGASVTITDNKDFLPLH